MLSMGIPCIGWYIIQLCLVCNKLQSILYDVIIQMARELITFLIKLLTNTLKSLNSIYGDDAYVKAIFKL